MAGVRISPATIYDLLVYVKTVENNEPGKTTSIWAKPRRCHWPLKQNYENMTSVAAQHCPILSCKAGAVGFKSDLPLTISSSFSCKDMAVWLFFFAAMFCPAFQSLMTRSFEVSQDWQMGRNRLRIFWHSRLVAKNLCRSTSSLRHLGTPIF